MNGRILVAADGTDGSLGALRIARALAERDGREVDVLGVVEPYYMEGVVLYGPPGAPLVVEGDASARMRRLIREQLLEVGGVAASWEPEIEIDTVGRAIARRADRTGAGLIVVGIGRHGRMERWTGAEAALHVVRLARVPVLAVQPGASGLPGRVVVATDFSGFSEDAALAALEVVADGAEVHLAHVSRTVSEELGEWARTYATGARARLDEAGDVLASRRALRVYPTLLDGDPGPEVLGLARRTGAELIAAGSHGHGFLDRILVGSVSTGLLRGAECSVLIAPPRRTSPELEETLAAAAPASAVPAAV